MRGERVAIVTGGTGALGQAITGRLLAGGAAVCVPYHGSAEAQHLLQESQSASDRQRLYTAAVDVTNPPAVAAFVADVRSRYGRVDVLVNGVGGFAGGDLVSTSLEQWNRMLALNLTTTYVACHAAVPLMREGGGGSVINIASRAVMPPGAGFIAYTVAKNGVITLTQALAKEVRAHRITVNAVLPSTMDTPANRAAMPDADHSQWVSVDSVAEVVAFLASEGARHISGALIPV